MHHEKTFMVAMAGRHCSLFEPKHAKVHIGKATSAMKLRKANRRHEFHEAGYQQVQTPLQAQSNRVTKRYERSKRERRREAEEEEA